MGIAYSCDSELDLAVARWEGATTFDEVHAHIRTVTGDAQWAQSTRLLTDLRSVSAEARPGAEELAQAAELISAGLASRAGATRWAIVADHTYWDAVKFDAMVHARPARTVVFNSLPNACTWLGIELGQASRILDDLRQRLERRVA